MNADPSALLITGDALGYIRAATDDPWPSVFTSLPDAAEMGWHIDDWSEWFSLAARGTILATDPNGYAIFYQTDRRHDGIIASKAGMILAAAAKCGARVVWHKVGIATEGVSLFRPSYTHLIAVSYKGTAGRPTPDVFTKGPKYYADATDTAALNVGLDLLDRAGITELADPFCGRGSIAHAASLRGYTTTSIDIDPTQTNHAAALIGSVAHVTEVGA